MPHWEEPPQTAHAAGVGLDQREQDRQDTAADQGNARQIEVSPLARGDAGQQPVAEYECHGTHGNVDEEDPAPALGSGGQGENEAPGDRTDRTGDADGGAEQTEGTSTLGSSEHLLDQRRILRRKAACGDSLRHTGNDEQSDRRGRPRRNAAQDKGRERPEENPASADRIAKTSGRHQRKCERQRIPGHHPLHRGRGGAQILLHRGQRDRDDRHIEQDHEAPTSVTHKARHRLGSGRPADVAVPGGRLLGPTGAPFRARKVSTEPAPESGVLTTRAPKPGVTMGMVARSGGRRGLPVGYSAHGKASRMRCLKRRSLLLTAP
ncbi:hypothetical protein SAV31267_005210 [Streptomyces avermitilis]|uniref:Uncharacterized protein n=1 Tax=Streptomyces avermitilis TaxID=33903 RepID=A0A4D4MGP9_STRAX|nr:hypothetical protein SAV31267_005210 [Streptomyces avermitilis]